ncbi:MAG: hypothetical protein JSW41_04075 [Candidatus Aenigmatarchaeota archaeon]|nr:MAG: hypothetical protein JSW41_04075 [Candidatus Aenigmarchaeota archaeon]
MKYSSQALGRVSDSPLNLNLKSRQMIKVLLIRVAWFLGIPTLGTLLILSQGTYDWGINDSIFNAPWRHPSFLTILGGVIFYAGLLLDIAFIGYAWYNGFKKGN